MSGAVLGPGGAGVLVAAADPEEALRRAGSLRRSGLRAATLDELGLDTPAPLPGSEDSARFWAVATRRPVVASDDEGVALAGPDGRPAPQDALPALVEAVPPRRVAVFGGAWTEEADPDYADARGLGRRLAEAGVQVVSGGYAGIMEAVSRGAAEAGGVAVGVTIGAWTGVTPNRWLTHEARARDLFARLPLICDADAWVAFSGGLGTLAEVALCWNLLQSEPGPPRPLLVVGERWRGMLPALRERLIVTDPADLDLVREVGPADAAEVAFPDVK